MLDGPLSAFELLVDNSMLTHVQQCTETEAHRVKNSDKWKLPLTELRKSSRKRQHIASSQAQIKTAQDQTSKVG